METGGDPRPWANEPLGRREEAHADQEATVLSTIAVRSGSCRIVIALLQNKDWVELKALEMTPPLSHVATSLEEALLLQEQHDAVLEKLASKQSPAEDLLSRADSLISGQGEKAATYAAMATSLAAAWQDLNRKLELRRRLLAHCVSFHRRSQSFRDVMQLAEREFGDVRVPHGANEARQAIERLMDVRKGVLEASLLTLQEGALLLEKLRQMSAKGAFDSRPNHMRSSLQSSCEQVEMWMEELHDRRRCVDVLFTNRRLILDQCLALALLYADLDALQMEVQQRSGEARPVELGDSASAAEILLFEHAKVETDAKALQDRGLLLLRSAEQLVGSGTYARDEPRTRAYGVLERCTQLTAAAERRRALLDAAAQFFSLAQQAADRMLGLEGRLQTAPPSQEAAVLAQVSEELERTVAPALGRGQAILDDAGGEGTEGVARAMEQLRAALEAVSARCRASKERQREQNRACAELTTRYTQIVTWLEDVGDSFLRNNSDLGVTLDSASHFVSEHERFKEELLTRETEVDELRARFPEVAGQMDAELVTELEKQADLLRSNWSSLQQLIDWRLEVGRPYQRCHQQDARLSSGLQQLSADLPNGGALSDDQQRRLEDAWLILRQQYHQLAAVAESFLDRSQQSRDGRLRLVPARQCVQDMLDRLRNSQVTLTERYETVQQRTATIKRLHRQRERWRRDAAKVEDSVQSLEAELYPLLPGAASLPPRQRLRQCEERAEHVLPTLQMALQQLREMTAAAPKPDPGDAGDDAVRLREEMESKTNRLATRVDDFQTTVQQVIAYLKKIVDLELVSQRRRDATAARPLPRDTEGCQRALSDHAATQQSFQELFRLAEDELDSVCEKIRRVEPPSAADHDCRHLRNALQHESPAKKDNSVGGDDDLAPSQDKGVPSGDKGAHVQGPEKPLQEKDSEELPGAEAKSVPTLEGPAESASEAKQKSAPAEKALRSPASKKKRVLKKSKKALTSDSKSSTLGKTSSDSRCPADVLETDPATTTSSAYERRRHTDTATTTTPTTERKRRIDAGTHVLVYYFPRKRYETRPIAKDDQTQWADWQASRQQQLEKQLTSSTFQSELANISQQLTELRRQLANTRGHYGSTLSEAKQTRHAFRAFEETIKDTGRRLEAFVTSAADRAGSPDSVPAAQLQQLQDSWHSLQRQVGDARRLIDLAVEHYTLLEQAEDWVRQGSRLLVEVGRQVSQLRSPEQARELRAQTADFLTPGQDDQRHRLDDVTAMARQLYGADTPARVGEVTQETRELVDSLNSVRQHLKLLESQLKPRTPDRASQEVEVAPPDSAAASLARAMEQLPRPATPPPKVDAFTETAVSKTVTVNSSTQEDHILLTDASTQDPHTMVDASTQDNRAWQESIIRESVLQQQQAPLPLPEMREPAPVAPSFTEQLMEQTVQRGVRHTLRARVSGVPPPEVSWLRDGAPVDAGCLPGQQGDLCTLTIENMAPEHAGLYSCRGRNLAGVAETRARITVKEASPGEQPSPPRFSRPLREVRTRAGQGCRLTATVTGHPLPVVSWSHDGVCVDDSEEYVITYNNGDCTLRVAAAETLHQGTYTCRAANMLGTAETTAELRVEPRVSGDRTGTPPQLLTPLSDVRGQPGAPLRLEGQVRARPPPDLTWLKDGRPVRAEAKVAYDGRRATLSIPGALSTDAGTYTLVARNVAGEVTSSCLVSLEREIPTEVEVPDSAGSAGLQKPTVTTRLRDVTAEEGQLATLDCVVTGNPSPQVTWYRDGTLLKESARRQLRSQDGRSVLTLSPVRPEDAGRYSVMATNQTGRATSSCQLSVRPKEAARPEPGVQSPKFTSSLSDACPLEGERLLLEAEVTGVPEPIVLWLKDGCQVKPSEGMKLSRQGGLCRLEIASCQSHHAGTYICVVSNAGGEARSFAEVVVTPAPPREPTPERGMSRTLSLRRRRPPTFVQIFKDQTVMPGADVVFECLIDARPQCKVEWLHEDSPVLPHQCTTRSDGGRHQLVISAAEPALTGQVKCVAENSLGKATCAARLTVQGPEEEEEEVDLTPGQHHHRSRKSKKTIIRETVEETHTLNGEKAAPGSTTLDSTEQHVTSTTAESRDRVNRTRSDKKHSSRMEEETTQQVQSPAPAQPPKFTEPLPGLVVKEGESVLMTGSFTGTATVSWLRDGQPISDKRVMTSSDDGTVSLRVEEAREEDAGEYTCELKNPAGTSRSTAELLVTKLQQAPRFERRLEAQVAPPGQTATMEVVVNGLPTPEVVWSKDGAPLTDARVSVHSDGGRHTLTIQDVQLSDAGKYAVCAKNTAGETTNYADFVVTDQMPAVIEKRIISTNITDEEPSAPGGGSQKTIITTTRTTTQETASRSPSPELSPTSKPKKKEKSSGKKSKKTKVTKTVVETSETVESDEPGADKVVEDQQTEIIEPPSKSKKKDKDQPSAKKKKKSKTSKTVQEETNETYVTGRDSGEPADTPEEMVDQEPQKPEARRTSTSTTSREVIHKVEISENENVKPEEQTDAVLEDQEPQGPDDGIDRDENIVTDELKSPEKVLETTVAPNAVTEEPTEVVEAKKEPAEEPEDLSIEEVKEDANAPEDIKEEDAAESSDRLHEEKDEEVTSDNDLVEKVNKGAAAEVPEESEGEERETPTEGVDRLQERQVEDVIEKINDRDEKPDVSKDVQEEIPTEEPYVMEDRKADEVEELETPKELKDEEEPGEEIETMAEPKDETASEDEETQERKAEEAVDKTQPPKEVEDNDDKEPMNETDGAEEIKAHGAPEEFGVPSETKQSKEGLEDIQEEEPAETKEEIDADKESDKDSEAEEQVKGTGDSGDAAEDSETLEDQPEESVSKEHGLEESVPDVSDSISEQMELEKSPSPEAKSSSDVSEVDGSLPSEHQPDAESPDLEPAEQTAEFTAVEITDKNNGIGEPPEDIKRPEKETDKPESVLSYEDSDVGEISNLDAGDSTKDALKDNKPTLPTDISDILNEVERINGPADQKGIKDIHPLEDKPEAEDIASTPTEPQQVWTIPSPVAIPLSLPSWPPNEPPPAKPTVNGEAPGETPYTPVYSAVYKSGSGEAYPPSDMEPQQPMPASADLTQHQFTHQLYQFSKPPGPPTAPKPAPPTAPKPAPPTAPKPAPVTAPKPKFVAGGPGSAAFPPPAPPPEPAHQVAAPAPFQFRVPVVQPYAELVQRREERGWSAPPPLEQQAPPPPSPPPVMQQPLPQQPWKQQRPPPPLKKPWQQPPPPPQPQQPQQLRQQAPPPPPKPLKKPWQQPPPPPQPPKKQWQHQPPPSQPQPPQEPVTQWAAPVDASPTGEAPAGIYDSAPPKSLYHRLPPPKRFVHAPVRAPRITPPPTPPRSASVPRSPSPGVMRVSDVKDSSGWQTSQVEQRTTVTHPRQDMPAPVQTPPGPKAYKLPEPIQEIPPYKGERSETSSDSYFSSGTSFQSGQVNRYSSVENLHYDEATTPEWVPGPTRMIVTYVAKTLPARHSRYRQQEEDRSYWSSAQSEMQQSRTEITHQQQQQQLRQVKSITSPVAPPVPMPPQRSSKLVSEARRTIEQQIPRSPLPFRQKSLPIVEMPPSPEAPAPPKPMPAPKPAPPPRPVHRAPVPSKFHPGQFSGSGYESDTSDRIPTRWQPSGYEFIDRRRILVDLPEARRGGRPERPVTPPSAFDRPAPVRDAPPDRPDVRSMTLLERRGRSVTRGSRSAAVRSTSEPPPAERPRPARSPVPPARSPVPPARSPVPPRRSPVPPARSPVPPARKQPPPLRTAQQRAAADASWQRKQLITQQMQQQQQKWSPVTSPVREPMPPPPAPAHTSGISSQMSQRVTQSTSRQQTQQVAPKPVYRPVPPPKPTPQPPPPQKIVSKSEATRASSQTSAVSSSGQDRTTHWTGRVAKPSSAVWKPSQAVVPHGSLAPQANRQAEYNKRQFLESLNETGVEGYKAGSETDARTFERQETGDSTKTQMCMEKTSTMKMERKEVSGWTDKTVSSPVLSLPPPPHSMPSPLSESSERTSSQQWFQSQTGSRTPGSVRSLSPSPYTPRAASPLVTSPTPSQSSERYERSRKQYSQERRSDGYQSDRDSTYSGYTPAPAPQFSLGSKTQRDTSSQQFRREASGSEQKNVVALPKPKAHESTNQTSMQSSTLNQSSSSVSSSGLAALEKQWSDLLGSDWKSQGSSSQQSQEMSKQRQQTEKTEQVVGGTTSTTTTTTKEEFHTQKIVRECTSYVPVPPGSLSLAAPAVAALPSPSSTSGPAWSPAQKH